MKIYSLMLVKNEEDIIAASLKSAASCFDKVIVLDNGSTDKTWEIVQSLANVQPNIIAFAQDDQPFRIGLRAILFNHFKHEMTPDDWWCIRHDADEFFVENPKEFLSKVPYKYKQVFKASIDYYITHEDIEEHQFTGNFELDKDKIRYYNPYTWAEVRFLRHSKKLNWDIDHFKPQPCGLRYSKQLKVEHYQFRSPQQMQKRYDVRQKAKAEGCGSFRHERGSSWQDYLRERKNLQKNEFNGNLQLLGNRNKFNRLHTRIFKYILTMVGYY